MSKSDRAALALLPLAALLFGPALDALAPDRISGHFLLSVLPTVMALVALLLVALLSYRRTRSAPRALRTTALAFAVAALGAGVYLLHAWSEASGS